MLRRLLFLSLFMTASVVVSQSQTRLSFFNRSINALVENDTLDTVSLDSSGRSYSTLYFEQRVYRTPVPVLFGVAENATYEHVEAFVPLLQGIPLVAFVREENGFRTIAYNNIQCGNCYDKRNFKRKSYLFDIRIHPDIAAIFGYFEHPIESKINVLVQSKLFLRKGLVLNWGILLPIINDLDNQPRNVRPAPIFLNQFLSFKRHFFASISAGAFYNDQYGINTQLRRFNPTSNWSWGLELSLTGLYFYAPVGIYYERPEYLFAIGDISYRLRSPDVTFKLSGGQFLFHDRGVRLDIIRQFSSIEVGFYGMATSNGATGGFHFALPISPGPVAQFKNFRLRTTDNFRWEYNYTRGYRIGEYYRTDYQLDQLLRQYHSYFIHNQFSLRNR